RAQGDVQDRALLRDVDLVAAEHGVDVLAEAGLLGELQQKAERLVGDAVLGIVEVDPGRLDDEPLPALAVVGKELAQMLALDLLIVLLQRCPGGQRAQRGRGHRRAPLSWPCASCCSWRRPGPSDRSTI